MISKKRIIDVNNKNIIPITDFKTTTEKFVSTWSILISRWVCPLFSSLWFLCSSKSVSSPYKYWYIGFAGLLGLNGLNGLARFNKLIIWNIKRKIYRKFNYKYH